MIRIGILGEIGSGKSYVAKKFGYPVFNADDEVVKLYRKDKKIFNKLKKKIPRFITKFPVNKIEVSRAILENKINLQKIIKIVHEEVKRKMKIFLKKNKGQKIIVLDIPLLLENKINKKDDILVFIKSKKSEILKRLLKRKNFNRELLQKFKKIQLPLDYKKNKSHYIIENDFKAKTIKKYVNNILKHILDERNNSRYRNNRSFSK